MKKVLVISSLLAAVVAVFAAEPDSIRNLPTGPDTWQEQVKHA